MCPVRTISRKGQASSSGPSGSLTEKVASRCRSFGSEARASAGRFSRSSQKQFFRCGQVGVNRRRDNHRYDMYRWSVRSFVDLDRHIVPFFEHNPLRTVKASEFDKFAAVIRLMGERRHLTVAGLTQIARIAESMNFRKPSRFLESSEAIRQPPHPTLR
jgi:hypothetical protein